MALPPDLPPFKAEDAKALQARENALILHSARLEARSDELNRGAKGRSRRFYRVAALSIVSFGLAVGSVVSNGGLTAPILAWAGGGLGFWGMIETGGAVVEKVDERDRKNDLLIGMRQCRHALKQVRDAQRRLKEDQ